MDRLIEARGRRIARSGFGATLLLLALLPARAFAARVVTLAPHLAELVCAAGACDQLVATVRYSDYPESVRALPQVGDAFTLSAEAVLAQKPDLVLAWDGGTPEGLIAQLQRTSVPLWSLRVETLDDIGTAVEQIGARLGTETQARAAAHRYSARIEQLRSTHRGLPPLRVLYQIGQDPAYTINRHSPISEAMTLCGAQNVFADLPTLSAAIGREALLAAQPDVVVWGAGPDDAAITAFWRQWPQVPAVRWNALFPLSADLLTRPTPRMADGAEQLCAALDALRERRRP